MTKKAMSVKFVNSVRLQSGRETLFITAEDASIEVDGDWCTVTEKDGRSTATPTSNVNWMYEKSECLSSHKDEKSEKQEEPRGQKTRKDRP